MQPSIVATPVATSVATSNNKHMYVIAFLTLAWIVTLILWWMTHKPCVCRGVVVQQNLPSHITHKVPFRGTFQVPIIASPPQNTDLNSVLDYLRKKGTNALGQPFNADIFKSLNMPWQWQWSTSTTPPTGYFPRGYTDSSYYLVFDSATGTWNITTVSPYGSA